MYQGKQHAAGTALLTFIIISAPEARWIYSCAREVYEKVLTHLIACGLVFGLANWLVM
jgi:hypothetical protein